MFRKGTTHKLKPSPSDITAIGLSNSVVSPQDHLPNRLLKKEEAAGIHLKSLSPMQGIHVEGIMDDPVEMWKRLKATHQSQNANNHFHAMQKLLGIHKEYAESLTDYITHVNSATNNLIALVPNMLTVQNIIDEIGIHAVIAGLDHIVKN